MNPLQQFRHNPDCPARGQRGQGNIHVHSQKEGHYRCTACRRTFAATADTPFYRLKVATDVVSLILTLMRHGCPSQAIVVAFGDDERTVAAWRDRAGQHAQRFHQHHVLQGRVELGHVQADELFVRAVGQRLWMALWRWPSHRGSGSAAPSAPAAMVASSPPWCGWSARPRRPALFWSASMVWPAYVTAFDRIFRDPVRPGRRGRPRLVAVGGLPMGQLIKRHSGRRLVGITRRAVRGTAEAIIAAVVATGTGTGTDINTAFIERLNATFGARLCPLARRGRATVRSEGVLTNWMNLMGCSDNFCCDHAGPRVTASSELGRKWRERTPAMAAGLTDHRWSMEEVLSFAIPLPAWVAPKRRGRPPKRLATTA